MWDVYDFLKSHPNEWFCSSDLRRVFGGFQALHYRVAQLECLENVEVLKLDYDLMKVFGRTHNVVFGQGFGYVVRFRE